MRITCVKSLKQCLACYISSSCITSSCSRDSNRCKIIKNSAWHIVTVKQLPMMMMMMGAGREDWFHRARLAWDLCSEG